MTTLQTPLAKTNTLVLTAPLSGLVVPIEPVPDPVSAQKMVGDGVSIDPISQVLLATCEGEYVALHARSLLTQIVVTNGDRVAEFRPASGMVNAARDTVLELVLAGGTTASAEETGPTVTSQPIIIPNPVGLHARPAAVLVQLAKQYQSAIRLHRGGDSANVRSVVAIMGLEVARGDTVTLEATGVDAAAAIAALEAAVRDGLGEAGAVAVTAASARLLSRPCSKSRVCGPRYKVHGQGDPSQAAIFAAHQELLADPELMDIVSSAIAKGKSAAFAWQQTYTAQADTLAQLKSELLAQRANDLRDVGDRVLRILTGIKEEALIVPANTILLAEDLTPSDMANLDPARVVGFATVAGGRPPMWRFWHGPWAYRRSPVSSPAYST